MNFKKYKVRLQFLKFRKVAGILLAPGVLLVFYTISNLVPDVNEGIIYYKNSSPQKTEFYDKYFHRILDAFKNKSRLKYSKRTFRSGKIPTIYFFKEHKLSHPYWKEQLKHIKSHQCPFPCRITEKHWEYKKADAVLIYLKRLKSKKHLKSIFPKRDSTQPWIMLNFEAPFLANIYYKPDYHDFNGIFNRTMTYRKDADIIVTHGFIVSKADAKLLPFDWRIENSNNSQFKPSLNPNEASITALISNCEDNSGRLDYINELKKHIKLDIYGKCGSLVCGSSMYVPHGYKTYEDECLKMIGTKYKYFLAFENSICKDYGTEKIYNLLYYPIVPIVMGNINYEEILPPHSYINAVMFSPAELAKYIQFLNDNPKEYNRYLSWRKEYTPSTVGGVRIMCDLCTKLYDPAFYEYNVITDFYKWFVTDSKCWKWSNKTELNNASPVKLKA